MYTINNNIACKPFEVTSNRTEIKSGFASIEQKIRLTKTEVLFHYKSDLINLNPGDFVYVRGEHTRQPYAKEIFLNDSGISFILLPLNVITSIEQIKCQCNSVTGCYLCNNKISNMGSFQDATTNVTLL